MPSSRQLPVRLTSALTAAALATGALATAVPAAAAPSPGPSADLPWPLVVTEIAPDNSGPDHFEFFEVTNTTDEPVDLAEHTFTYVFTNEGSSGSDRPLTLAEDTATVPAGGSAVLWLQYTSSTVDSFARSDDDFRAAVGAEADVPLFHVTGQAGMANSAERGIRVDDASGDTVSWSVYDRVSTAPDVSTHFAVPAEPEVAAMVELSSGPHTPGVVDPDQLTPTEPEPDPEPSVPEQGAPPPSDPDLDAPELLVTEVAPDTTNVGGADGYEFIEVYNASDAPVPFSEHTIDYLYLDGSHLVTNSATWSSVPRDPVIEPGRTLVLWIKNGSNDDLTAADFNAHFGSRLTAGVDLVEIPAAGMANGGQRGIQVVSNSGHVLSRADYMDDDQTVADRPIQYRWDEGTNQTLVGTGLATPGYASPDQVPAGLVVVPEDAADPVISDLTGDGEAGGDLPLRFDVTDDRRVTTVELTLATDVGEPSTRNLRFGEEGAYVYDVPAVDVYGKAWAEYTLTASDGVRTSTLGPVRVDLADGEPDPVRLDVTDGQHVGGRTRVTATTAGAAAALRLAVDGVEVAATPSLEAPAMFAFEATSTDAFFRNGVKIDDEVLTVFDEGFYELVETVASEVPIDRVVPGESVTLGIYAGTKAWPEPDPDENNDDFSAYDVRLALPDGRVLLPVACGGAGEDQEETVRDCPAPGARIGFSDADQVYFTATFDVPDDAFDSLAHVWDTTALPDGEHTITATAGEETVTRTVVVDNTAPEVATDLTDGETYRGEIVVGARATDAGSGVATLTAILDGEEIELPYSTSSIALEAGEHTLVLEAEDEVGNTTTRTVGFSTPDETPDVALGEPADGAVVDAGDVVLSATPDTATGDVVDVEFRRGLTYGAADAEVSAFAGTTTDASATERDGRTALTEEEAARTVTADGTSSEISSDSELPYQLFTVDVPDDAGTDGQVRVSWTGSANADAKVLLSVLDTADDSWDEIDRHVTTDGVTELELGGTVPLADHVRDGEVTVLVQHSEGFAGTERSPREDAAAPFHPDATPRSEYDFTIGWESDTQYYNDNEGQPTDGSGGEWYSHQEAIHDFFLDRRDELNLQYVVHTGDVVDDWDQEYQWANADPSYRMLDEAGLPYGVLAGNHDVGGALADYGPFSRHFGADRFSGNPWYGGDHQDNRGHYDLVSVDGVDLLLLYMGWAPGDEQIDWMNEVIAQYPERTVWLNLHEYMLTTGGLGPVPQQILDEVVAPNSNVALVSSGHYHDAYTRTDDFDDDGDGVADRTVYSMLFDYQGLAEGGLGYMRLLHFDNDGGEDGTGRIVVRTYSPSLDDFDSDDAALNDPSGMQDFEIPYAALGLTPTTKTLATDALSFDVLTTESIDTVTGVASGETASGTWSGVEPGEHGWFAEVTGPFGGVVASPVRTFTAREVAGPVVEPGTPRVVAPGRGGPREGKPLRVDPGRWTPGTQLTFVWRADGEEVAAGKRRTYKPDASDVGRRITVEVTGTKKGHEPATATSQPTEPVAGR
ncbi:lamin tail domain-containing protein [Isoptericola halotolerans]|uniref:metallophosphoesterase n=1 Tax=Isoptericola halotolerans TaxID=300560 RepID=UPI003890D4D9